MHMEEVTAVILRAMGFTPANTLWSQRGQTYAGKTGTSLKDLQNWLYLKLEAFGVEGEHLWARITD